MKHLPLSGLRAFEAAARTGSFRLAAADLHLTPSAVSHAMLGLERTLGAQLFTRQGRAVRLTPDGETLMQSVRRGFDELQHGISAISTRGPPLLRLHSAPSFAAQWLVPRLPRFLAECPGQDVRIAASATYTLFIHDEFDLEIFYGDPWGPGHAPGRHANLAVLPLGQETVTPLCAPALAKKIKTPRALLSQTLIESDNKQVRWPAWFAANGLPPPEPRGPRFDRSFLSLSAAADGLGVALESTRLAERELASGRLVRPFRGGCEDITYTGHWLVFPRSDHYGRALISFAQWLFRELGLGDRPLAGV
ncbi:MAG: LysR family transcriptional regulator [Acidisphaera sp.]|nr:LysR family transcriptional regulator [Acidisphaera sp.]